MRKKRLMGLISVLLILIIILQIVTLYYSFDKANVQIRKEFIGLSEGDFTKVAVKATEEAIKTAGNVGADVSEATKHAVTGALEAADEIGTEASKTVRNVLSSSIKGAKDIIKTPFK